MSSDIGLTLYQYYGLWIQSGAIVASGVAVIITMLVQRGIARRRATLDFIVMQQTAPTMTDQRQKFVELREKGNLQQWATKSGIASPEATLIRSTLNIYELIAIGIANHTLDEEIYRRWYRTTYVKDWIELKGFVGQYQKDYNPTLFCEYEALAKKLANTDEAKHV
jgi:hypothetical protein